MGAPMQCKVNAQMLCHCLVECFNSGVKWRFCREKTRSVLYYRGKILISFFSFREAILKRENQELICFIWCIERHGIAMHMHRNWGMLHFICVIFLPRLYYTMWWCGVQQQGKAGLSSLVNYVWEEIPPTYFLCKILLVRKYTFLDSNSWTHFVALEITYQRKIGLCIRKETEAQKRRV